MSVTFGNATATGVGTQEIEFGLGSNTTRSRKTYTYSLSAGSGSSAISGGTLTVTQNVVPLAITYTTGYEGKPTYSDTETTPMVFTGTANGKYLKCVLQSVGTVPGGREHAIGFTSLVESSGDTDQTISTPGTYVEVSNHNSGSYNFTLNLVANPTGPVGDYEVRVYTSDDASGAGELYQSYYISILPYIKIIGDDAISNNNNYSVYEAEYYPSAPSTGSMVWTVTGPGGESIEGKVSVTTVPGFPNKKKLTLVDNTLSNYVIAISVVNSEDSLIDGTKSGIQCIYASTYNQAPFEFVDYPSYNTDVTSTVRVYVGAEDTSAYEPELRLSTSSPVVSTNEISIANVTARNSSNLTAAFNSKTKKVWVTFNKATSYSGGNYVDIGSVQIAYTPSGSGAATFVRVVNYQQETKSIEIRNTTMTIYDLTTPTANPNSFTLTRNASTGALELQFDLRLKNDNSVVYKLKGLNGKITAYSSNSLTDPDCEVLFSQTISSVFNPNEADVSANSTWNQVYTYPVGSGSSWIPTYPSGKSWNDVRMIILEIGASQRKSTASVNYLPLDIEE